MKLVQIITALLIATPATSSTIDFTFTSLGPISVSDDRYGDSERAGKFSLTFTFNAPTYDEGDFVYSSRFTNGLESNVTSNIPASFRSVSGYNHGLGNFVEGSAYASIIDGIASIRMDAYDGGDHFTYVGTDRIFVDHNSGLFFESAKGRTIAYVDGTAVSPVPLPAGGALLFGALAVLGWRRVKF